MYCASSLHLSGSRPYFVSSPLVLTCTKTGSGGLPKFSTALFSLLASCRPRQLSAVQQSTTRCTFDLPTSKSRRYQLSLRRLGAHDC